MIVHSDSDLSFIPALLLILAGFFGVSMAVMLMAGRNFRAAAKTLAAVAGLSLAYVVVVIAVSLLSPQKVVNIGDSYCEDIWCIGIERVNVEPLDGSKKYDVAVRIFSDANSTDISAKGAYLYLMDERGRLFPSIRNTEAVPFDMILKPHQSINTSITFVAASDARQLFLTGVRGGTSGGGRIPLVARILVSLYLGSDTSLLHKPTLLRVL